MNQIDCADAKMECGLSVSRLFNTLIIQTYIKMILDDETIGLHLYGDPLIQNEAQIIACYLIIFFSTDFT